MIQTDKQKRREIDRHFHERRYCRKHDTVHCVVHGKHKSERPILR